MTKNKIDSYDRSILRILQRDAATPVAVLAEAAGLTQTPCWRRIKKMEEAGILARRVALVDADAVNLGLTAFVTVKAAHHTQSWLDKFAAGVRAIPEIVELHRLSGDVDYLMKIVCPDMAAYDLIYKKLIKVAEFSDVSSTFSMEKIKETTELPLEYV